MIILQLEQRGLPWLRGFSCLDLLPALLANLPPAKACLSIMMVPGLVMARVFRSFG
jgi:hypothetical protein